MLAFSRGLVAASEKEKGGDCKALGHCLKKCLAGGGGMEKKDESGIFLDWGKLLLSKKYKIFFSFHTHWMKAPKQTRR